MSKIKGPICGGAKDKKADIAKPFAIGHYNFFPCCYPRNTKNGFKFYLGIRGRCGYVKSEIDSPMFKNKAEAQVFIDKKLAGNITPV